MSHPVAPEVEADLDEIWLYIAIESGSMDVAVPGWSNRLPRVSLFSPISHGLAAPDGFGSGVAASLWVNIRSFIALELKISELRVVHGKRRIESILAADPAHPPNYNFLIQMFRMKIFPVPSISNPIRPLFLNFVGSSSIKIDITCPLMMCVIWVPAGDDVELIPVVDLDVAAQFVLIAERGQQPRRFTLLRAHHLSAPRNNPAAGRLFVVLAAVAVRAVEIELRSQHVPFGLGFSRWRRTARGSAGAKRRPQPVSLPPAGAEAESRPGTARRC